MYEPPPHPPRQRRAVDRRPALAWSELPGRLPVTFLVGAATLLVFALEYLLGGTTSTEVHLRLGALRPSRVLEEGELYRLFMPMLLHHGPIHLIMNGLAYVQLMLLTEYLYGSVRALGFYVVCGLGATLTTTFLAPPWIGGSVGASGAIMGLAGLLLGASWYGREPWRGRLRRMFGRRLAFGVLLTFALGIGVSFVVPIVDNWGHAGGFFTGLLLAALNRDPLRDHGGVARIVAGFATAAWLGAAAWTVVDGAEATERYDHDVAELVARRVEAGDTDGYFAATYLAEMVRAHHRAGEARDGRGLLAERLALAQDPVTPATVVALLLEDSDRFDRELMIALRRWHELAPEDPVALNALAWHLVTRPEGRRNPERAERLAARSLALLEAPEVDRAQRAAVLDTHAEALYQLGRFEEALVHQREAVRLGEAEGMSELPDMRERLSRIEAAVHPG